MGYILFRYRYILIMRKILRNLWLTSLGCFRKPNPGIHILNAHYMNPTSDPDNGEQLKRQIKQILKYAELIRIEKAVELINNKIKVDIPLVAFTFDDGFLDCYTVIAPILESFGTNAAFFINPNLVECSDSYYEEFSKRATINNKKIMNWEQIKELYNRGHIIGSHTMDHLNLGDETLSEAILFEQIANSKRVIETKVGNNCNMFAFPYGTFSHLSEKALDIALKNYEYIFSGTDYKNYFSFDNKVINRRHLEPFWSIPHLKYFLSVNKKY